MNSLAGALNVTFGQQSIQQADRVFTVKGEFAGDAQVFFVEPMMNPQRLSLK